MARLAHHVKNEHVDSALIFGISVLCVLTISLGHSLTRFWNTYHRTTRTAPSVTIATHPFVITKDAFKDVVIQGRAYVVYDLVTKEVIASKNATDELPLASITKVMMALSATLHKDTVEKVVISPTSIEGGYDLGLKKNQSWTLPELLKYTLVFSSNDGAEAVAESFGGPTTFVAQMNRDASLLGLHLIFTDPAGRDLSGQIGGIGSALEVAKLFGIARMHFPEIFDATTKRRATVVASTGRVSGVPNTNQKIETLSGAEASKTGYTELAGGNLGVVVDIAVGHPIAIVVLGSTREGRFSDVEKLYKALQESVTTLPTR